MKQYSYRTGLGSHNVSSIVFEMVGRNKKVLEVGCSVGTQTRALVNELGCDVTGIEIDESAAALARDICGRVIVGSFESEGILSDLEGEKFDVVLFADVLEHLYSPGLALQKAKGVLGDGGQIIASVPNITHASIAWEIAHGRFDYQRFGLLDDTHIRFFAKRTLEDLFDEAGLQIIEWRRFSLPIFEAGFTVLPVGDRDAEFMNFVSQNNPESETFQFVVRAGPRDATRSTDIARATALAHEKDELQRKLATSDAEVRRLKSNIQWMEANSVAMRGRNFLKRLVGR